MKMQVLSVFDHAVQAFMRPIFTATVDAAVREFGIQVNKQVEGNLMNTHPQDFSLFHLGTFDDQDGSHDVLAVPRRVLNGAECVRVVSPGPVPSGAVAKVGGAVDPGNAG